MEPKRHAREFSATFEVSINKDEKNEQNLDVHRFKIVTPKNFFQNSDKVLATFKLINTQEIENERE